MKRIIPVLVIATATALFWFRERWLPAAADHAAYLGYVEGETTLIGAATAGRIISVNVTRGQKTDQGAVLFQLDDTAARSEITRLAAAVETAKATVANLETGKRTAELELISRQHAEAQANLDLANIEYARAKSLSQRGVSAETAFDRAKTALTVAEERLKQVEANTLIAKLPAREAELAAARSRVTEADAARATAQARLADYQGEAPLAAIVDDVFFDAGEVVAAGQPIVSLLQPGKTKLRFYVPEADRAKAAAGVAVRYSCDGCGASRSASITHVASVPEYTPPVIYSSTARAKLVFLVEAVPAQADPILQPGLPIEVEALP